ncbi:MAG: hypothetical protein ACP5H2_08145 [Solirubrobacteraceae bacterium]
MSFNVSAVGAPGALQVQSAPTTSATQTAAATASLSEDAVSVDVSTEASLQSGGIPPSPPAEVRRAITVAGQSYQRLQASGRHLSFTLDSGSGALTVQMQDLDGNPIANLSLSDALKIAAGEVPVSNP